MLECLWCDGAFLPRATGGSPARFCSQAHHALYHSAVRRWAEAEIAAGRLTVARIRNDAACTLPPGGSLPAPAPEALPGLLRALCGALCDLEKAKKFEFAALPAGLIERLLAADW
jgi:hypothetical protein